LHGKPRRFAETAPGRAAVDSGGPFCYTRGQTGARAMALWRIGGLRHIQDSMKLEE